MSLDIDNVLSIWPYYTRNLYENDYKEETSKVVLLSTNIASPTSPLGEVGGRSVASDGAESFTSRPGTPGVDLRSEYWEGSLESTPASYPSPGAETTIKTSPSSKPSVHQSPLEAGSSSSSSALTRPPLLPDRIGCCGINDPNKLDKSSPPVNSSCRPPKRRRPLHDVDGPGTAQLSSKKRRLRLHLITSRLSLPFSLPATHILNRESDEDTPVLSRFVKYAAIGAKRAGHQTALVRKAAILNRVRLNVRQAAVNRGHEKIWKMAGMGVMGHGIQLVTASTGAMFPGRSGEQVPGPIVPRAWRPHTTTLNASPSTVSHLIHESPDRPQPQDLQPPVDPRHTFVDGHTIQLNAPPVTSIMTPMPGDDDESSFPAPDMDSRYADMSDDDMDDVYADFGVLFGGASAASPENTEEDDHFYEEYLDEVDGITWAS